MALIHRPPLLLLDEPTVGADIESRQQLLGLVTSLAAEGAAVCYSTHYLPEVEVLGATIAVLDGGRVVVRGSLPHLLATYAQPAVELEFGGEPPAHLDGPGTVRHGTRIRIPAPDPAATAAAALSSMRPGDPPLVRLEVLHPTLESVYLAVTGRRYAADGAEATGEGAVDVTVA
jgi:ABC-2 type transport system ATP-binding protein